MWHTLVRRATQVLGRLQLSLVPPVDAVRSRPVLPSPPGTYAPVTRVWLSDEVGRTLFEEYASHRAQGRGAEETGWVLLGLRHTSEMVVLATLPAGTLADSSMTHVRFNSMAQVVGSRIVRQQDRRLTTLGVVHTHPGSLRHPSEGDFQGDRQWVQVLRGKEGIFGIGTADGQVGREPATAHSHQPRPNVQCWGELRFSWYALGQGDTQYRPVAIDMVHGPDLARGLHELWATLETHADSLERLVRQQNGVRFQVIRDEWGPGLVVVLLLAEQGDALRVLIRPKDIRYYLLRQGEVLEVQREDGQLDRAVYLLLAELAAQARS